jgi:hypothetical protein
MVCTQPFSLACPKANLNCVPICEEDLHCVQSVLASHLTIAPELAKQWRAITVMFTGDDQRA